MPAEHELLNALAPFLNRLKSLIEADATLQRDVATLGRAFVGWVEGQTVAVEAPLVPTLLPEIRKPKEGILPATLAASLLTFHLTAPPLVRTESHYEESTSWLPQEPIVIANRCRVKAEACRLIAQRHRNASSDSSYMDSSAGLRSKAERLIKCTLWMLDISTLSRSATVWEDLAAAYDVGADAAELLHHVLDPRWIKDRELLLSSLNLAAEAQGLLFAAVIDTTNMRPDADQIQLYVTVRELAAAHSTYIQRYMKREDRVDPRTWPSLKQRIAVATSPLRDSQVKSGGLKKILNNLKYKLGKAGENPNTFDDWPRVIELLDEAVAAGMPPSHLETREQLVPVLDVIPDEIPLPKNAALVFREIDEYRRLKATVEQEAVPVDRVSDEVVQVAKWLKGRAIVLIGGLVRPEHKAALIRAFGLSDVYWETLPEHSSISAFEAGIIRPETAIVLLAIRWSSHSYAEVQRFCSDHGKLLVRLPGGYHPNQVAHQIIIQAGDRLAAIAPEQSNPFSQHASASG